MAVVKSKRKRELTVVTKARELTVYTAHYMQQ